ncbi:protein FAM3D [Sorex araneus]|uniref:protein FAM3D n=1 Tax=Sorex araneus TaxID=42254 RepID=UPI000649E5A9|nr:protein FAM3D [Sorex araneus]
MTIPELKAALLRFLVLIIAVGVLWVFILNYPKFKTTEIRLPRWMASSRKDIKMVKHKCDLNKPCPGNKFAFKVLSGAANVVGPSICFENEMIMSPVKNNVGRGLNIALVNGSTGMTLRYKSFDMYSGDPKVLLVFLKEIPEDALVLVASYDDPGTKMDDSIRQLFSDLGSNYAKQLGFRDSWVFMGARHGKSKSPYEKFLKNNPKENKYADWPELVEIEGCVSRKLF